MFILDKRRQFIIDRKCTAVQQTTSSVGTILHRLVVVRAISSTETTIIQGMGTIIQAMAITITHMATTIILMAIIILMETTILMATILKEEQTEYQTTVQHHSQDTCNKSTQDGNQVNSMQSPS